MTFFMSYSYLFSFCCLHLIHAIGNGHKKPWDCIIFLCRIYLIVSWSKHFTHFKIFIITFTFVLIRATNWEVMVARVRISALFAWICGPSRVITWPQKCQQKLNVWPKMPKILTLAKIQVRLRDFDCKHSVNRNQNITKKYDVFVIIVNCSFVSGGLWMWILRYKYALIYNSARTLDRAFLGKDK